jgi:hypothetical protein
MMPDVCAALESEDGRTTEQLYRAGCERWLDCAPLNGLERYNLRCSLLHRGQAQPDGSRLKPGEGAQPSENVSLCYHGEWLPLPSTRVN